MRKKELSKKIMLRFLELMGLLLVVLLIFVYREIRTYGYADQSRLEISGQCTPDAPFFAPIYRTEHVYRTLDDVVYLKKYKTFASLEKLQIPDFQFKDVCEKYHEAGCEQLETLKKEQRAIFDWNNSREVQNIKEQNEKIIEKNHQIDLKNNEIRNLKSSFSANYGHILRFIGIKLEDELLLWDEHHDYRPKYTSFTKNTSPLQRALIRYMDEVKFTINRNSQKVDKAIEFNKNIIEENKKIEKENNELEIKNNGSLKEFETFWTTEKKKELLDEFKEALNKNCFGCDYEGNIPANSKGECLNSCPNRAWKDGKCILKK